MRIDEAVFQWKAALKRMMCGAPALEIPSFPGLTCYWANVAMPLLNHAILATPVTSVHELTDRLAPLMPFATARAKAWMFSYCDPWTPDGVEQAMSSLGLTRAMNLTGMFADRVNTPVSQAAHDIRPLSGTEGSRLVGDLNCAAYGIPLEWGWETAWESFFGPDVFSYALYEDGLPASTATAFLIDGWLNVVCVATPAPFQRKGYAEAVVRYTLARASEATGITRTVLHASDAGYPLYLRMGYKPIAKFTAWSPTG